MEERAKSNFSEPRIFLAVVTVLVAIVIVFYFIASMVTSVGYQTFAGANSTVIEKKSITIILDAGHGGEDPGAVANGVVEKDINLSVTQKLSDFLSLSGYKVLLTRSGDRMLYNDGQDHRKKYFDLYNRVQIAAGETNGIFVSIHANKFPLESCFGMQTFYSPKNSENRLLATYIQDASKLLNVNNTRVAKQDDNTIFVLKNLSIPSVLIECGFLSNPDEAKLLSTEAYRDQLAFTICCGIVAYLQEYNIENQLYLQ
jgi:N-acetylmuramoyl-L-alanine amidase